MILLNDEHFVYRLTIKGHKFFYIGMTDNIERRKSAHASMLNSCIKILKNDRKLRSKTNLSGFYKVAKEIIRKQVSFCVKEGIGSEVIKIKVIATKSTSLEASILEQQLLDKHFNNDYCFNLSPFLTYNHGKTIQLGSKKDTITIS